MTASKYAVLVSLQKIDALLVDLNKKRCPWCDGNIWAIRGTTNTNADLDHEVAGIRSMPETKLYLDQEGKLKGDLNLGTTGAMPLVTVRCSDCGYVYLFDYFYLVQLYNKRKDAEDRHE